MIKARMTHRTFVCFHRTGFYFRVANRGLSVDFDLPKIFSERAGYRKVLRVGRLSIEVLR